MKRGIVVITSSLLLLAGSAGLACPPDSRDYMSKGEMGVQNNEFLRTDVSKTQVPYSGPFDRDYIYEERVAYQRVTHPDDHMTVRDETRRAGRVDVVESERMETEVTVREAGDHRDDVAFRDSRDIRYRESYPIGYEGERHETIRVANEGIHTNTRVSVKDTFASDTDRSLASRIRSAFERDASLSAAGNDISISTSGGDVTLKGTVKTIADKYEAGMMAQKLAGAGDVHNDLAVEGYM